MVSFMIFKASVRNILNIPSCMPTDGQAAIMKAFSLFVRTHLTTQYLSKVMVVGNMPVG
jgi:hypothetical protein